MDFLASHAGQNSFWLGAFFLSLLVGFALLFLIFKFLDFAEKSRAQSEADELLDEAKEKHELLQLEIKAKELQIEEDLWSQVEEEFLQNEELIAEKVERIEEEKEKLELLKKENENRFNQNTIELGRKEKKLLAMEQRQSDRKKHFLQQSLELRESIIKRLKLDLTKLKAQVEEEFLSDVKRQADKQSELLLEELQLHLEARAKRVLSIAIERFARPYCPERGINPVQYPSEAVKQQFLEDKSQLIPLIQDLCGCDLVLDSEHNQVGIAGFDPVRRELTRRTLEKIFKDKKAPTRESIQRRFNEAKRELFKDIKQDGDLIARELRLEGLHPEIRQMMGSLRYRYSFTQNQYFHCAEVGFLAGLLASELGLDLKKARRSGLLHDIGKSMDHSIEGGHAMIGADFIQKRGENPDIVHAVRAHHFDEQPASELAWLVIAADAISGARPGARRSTSESYNQKVTELEAIAKSFPGISDAYILSGGREVRAIANAKMVDDAKAIELAKVISKRVEQEVSYPGTIKVVIVRSTVAQELTKQYA